jgi:hypothetical protein
VLECTRTIMRGSTAARWGASLAAAAFLSLVSLAVAAPPEILVYYAVCRTFRPSRSSTDAAMPQMRCLQALPRRFADFSVQL